MSLKNKTFIITGLLFSIYTAYQYSEELYVLLLPLVVFIKVKFTYYLSVTLTTLTAFFAVSKTKFLFFLKTLTMYKAIILTIKRFVIDNYFSKWMANNIINPIKDPLLDYMKFFFKLGFKTKMKRMAYFFLPMSVMIFLAQLSGVLESILLLAELKAVVIGFFKLLWIFLAKVGAYFSTAIFAVLKNTWLVSIIEIFALSWLMGKLEKIPYIGKYIVKFFNSTSKGFGKFFSLFVDLYNKYIYSHISLRVKSKMEKLGTRLFNFLENTKHENEIFILDNFMKEFISNNRFKEYHKNIKFKKMYNKNDIYKLWNKKTKDNVDIKYFFNIDVNSILNDVLIIESVASCSDTGNTTSVISKHSFWILNLSNKIVKLESLSGNFFTREIKPNKIKLVHSLNTDFENVRLSYGNESLIVNDVYYSDKLKKKEKEDKKKSEKKEKIIEEKI